MADIPRQPLITKRPASSQVQQAGVVASLLLNTLAQAPAAAPFKPYDFGNPVRRVQRVDYHVLDVGLFHGVDKPAGAADWTLRPAAKVVQQPELFVNRLNLPVSTQAPFSLTDWPNPVVARKVRQPDCPSDLLTNTLVALPWGQPLHAKSLPQPVRAQRFALQPDIAGSLLGTTLYVAPGSAFVQSDWPNPVVRKYVTQHQQINGDLQLLTYVPPQYPFNNYDWPNPKPIKPKPELWSTGHGVGPDMMPPPLPGEVKFRAWIMKDIRYTVQVDGKFIVRSV